MKNFRLLAMLALFAASFECFAMNMNVPYPWQDAGSVPHLSFYAPNGPDNLIFQGDLDSIDFRIFIDLRPVSFSWTLHHNGIVEPILEGGGESSIDATLHVSIPTKNLVPGFYDLVVSVNTGTPANKEHGAAHRPVEGKCTFGWRVENILAPETRTAEFESFWKGVKAKIDFQHLDSKDESRKELFDKDAIGLYNLESAMLPADYDPSGHVVETVESWKVGFAGPDGGRVHGWLAKPLGNGPFPAMLVLPGAGNAPRPRPLEQARHGYVALDIQAHGLDVDLPTESYPILEESRDVSHPGTDWHVAMFGRVLLAIEYLAKRSDVDPSRIVLVGGSQGGELGIVGAALDHRVSAVVSCISYAADYPHRRFVQACNNAKLNGSDPTAVPMPPVDEAHYDSLFDTMNFAPYVRCPILFNAGLVDPVSTPQTIWSSYCRIGISAGGSADKEIVWLPGLAHDWSSGFDRYAWKWLKGKIAP